MEKHDIVEIQEHLITNFRLPRFYGLKIHYSLNFIRDKYRVLFSKQGEQNDPLWMCINISNWEVEKKEFVCLLELMEATKAYLFQEDFKVKNRHVTETIYY